ncbi:MAG: ATP-binding protein [Actinomycetota bacterium]
MSMTSAEQAAPAIGLSFDHLPDGVIVVGANEKIFYVNYAAEELLGRSRNALIEKNALHSIPFQDLDGHSWWERVNPWRDEISQGQSEQVLTLPGGERPVTLLVTARFVRRSPDEVVESVVLGIRDAKARHSIQEEQGILISTVAHELRSPLTSVKGFTATLLRRWERFTDDQKRFMLETIEHDADRVTRLIAELLDISRIDAGRLEIRRQPIDLVVVARRHIERMQAAGNQGRDFVLRISSDVPEVWADPDRVDQVLANLLENAIRHGAGTVTLELQRVQIKESQLAVSVIVSDEGEGIAEHDHPLVFTRFWQGNRRGGTGLGLYLVRGLVEAHGGHIDVGRTASGGAQFRFVLPVSVPEHVG